jgi:hypothetical protein
MQRSVSVLGAWPKDMNGSEETKMKNGGKRWTEQLHQIDRFVI